jgi:hypothetical protein
MGYDIRIEREEPRNPIALDDWLRVLNEEPEMQLVGSAEARSPTGEVIHYESKGLAVWDAHPGKRNVGFDYRNGTIVVKNPDAATLAKMRSIAVKLGARVRGDEGEFYDEKI